MAWAVEAIATGPHGAVKVTVMFNHEPEDYDVSNARVEASGMYRRFYRQWCERQPTTRMFEIKSPSPLKEQTT